MGCSRTDAEIIELAGDVVRSIVDDIFEAHYAPVLGTLTIGWSDEAKFNASAYSHTSRDGVPYHRLVLNYELITQLYRYAEGFYEFTQDDRLKEVLGRFPDDYVSFPLVPSSVTQSDCVNNMFFAALTWILFHELGHAVQEHGFIRKGRGAVDEGGEFHTQEIEGAKVKPLTGMEAIISHVTELAADCEATAMATTELVRHAISPGASLLEVNWKIVLDNCYLLVAGMTYTFCRFNNGRDIPAEAATTGSHPNAFYRLELLVRQMCGHLVYFAEVTGQSMTHRDLLVLVKQAADLGSMYWYFEHSDMGVDLESLVIKGLLERPEFKSYAEKIIPVWDDLLPQILSLRHFGKESGVLRFDKEYRGYVFGDV